MYLLYNLIGFAFIIGFLMLLFLVAWYIAVPLMIIGFFIWLIQWGIEKITWQRPFILKKKKKTKRPTKDQVIDVEWTEV